ncbi:hypothetical protein ACFSTA_09110 [Ornithinibacillus salinisoli]|uniref:Resolvase/invertase-type recombinase catalytic domain-containing protein n=1 Tax=Ornithinibacillus salinisoli TaxID=1848459 RepID=A0ABW4VY81_9BACI
MTVLFGTIEYFERELLVAAKNRPKKLSEIDQIKSFYSLLENEISYDYICDDSFRKDCLQNLTTAYEKIISQKTARQVKISLS